VDRLPPEIPFWDDLSSILFDGGTRITEAGVGKMAEEPGSSAISLAPAVQEGMLVDGSNTIDGTYSTKDVTDMPEAVTQSGARDDYFIDMDEIDVLASMPVVQLPLLSQQVTEGSVTTAPDGRLPMIQKTKINTGDISRGRVSKAPQKKKGPRFKYVYDCPEQAAEARRQRNRAAALRSYHKKREYLARIEAEVAELEREHEELLNLLEDVTAGTIVDIDGPADIERYLMAKRPVVDDSTACDALCA
jgi:hypothetical protein